MMQCMLVKIVRVSYLFPGCFYEYKIGCDIIVKLFDIEKFVFLLQFN